jgi:hypothetical protein
MALDMAAQAELEVAQFLVGRPDLEAMVRFRLSPAVVDRIEDLRGIERRRAFTDDERREMETYQYLAHFMKVVKAEAVRALGRAQSPGIVPRDSLA